MAAVAAEEEEAKGGGKAGLDIDGGKGAGSITDEGIGGRVRMGRVKEGMEEGGTNSLGPGAVAGGGGIWHGGEGLARTGGGPVLKDLQLGIANEDGLATVDSLKPVQAIAELRDVGEEVTLDDLLDRDYIRVLIEDWGPALPRVSERLGGR